MKEYSIEIDPTYAKVTKAGKNVFRLETKEAEDLDSWPTLVGEYATKEEAIAVIDQCGYTLIRSWRDAIHLEGWLKPYPRPTLV